MTRRMTTAADARNQTGKAPGPKRRERRCVATGETRDEAGLVRIAIGPEGELVPDVTARLPGRGVWVTASRDAVETAVKRKAFARSAKTAVTVPDGLADRIAERLADRALSLLGLARRSGDLAVGFDTAHAALKSARPAWRVEASDAAEDGRGKLDRLAAAAWDDIPVAGCFTAAELGQALGRDHVVHAVLTGGPQTGAFGETMNRLAGFRMIDPGRNPA